MNEEQKRLLAHALSNLKCIIDGAVTEIETHNGSAGADATLTSTLATIRELSVMIEDSFTHHVGAAELLRRAGARAKVLSASKKNG